MGDFLPFILLTYLFFLLLIFNMCGGHELRFLCRYAFPWWREKEIVSEERRSQGLCPLTPEETSLVLQALGFGKETQIYIASGEIYGSERRLAALRAAFPQIVS